MQLAHSCGPHTSYRQALGKETGVEGELNNTEKRYMRDRHLQGKALDVAF